MKNKHKDPLQEVVRNTLHKTRKECVQEEVRTKEEESKEEIEIEISSSKSIISKMRASTICKRK